jgi:hypothetical protein
MGCSSLPLGCPAAAAAVVAVTPLLLHCLLQLQACLQQVGLLLLLLQAHPHQQVLRATHDKAARPKQGSACMHLIMCVHLID